MGQKNAQFNLVHFILLFNNIKIVYRAEQYQIRILHMGFFRNCCLWFRPHLNCLARQFYYASPLAMLINILIIVTESKLNNSMWCFVNMQLVLHIELHLMCSVVCCTLPRHESFNWTCITLVCASCHVYACAFTMLYASFRFAYLISFGFVPEL